MGNLRAACFCLLLAPGPALAECVPGESLSGAGITFGKALEASDETGVPEFHLRPMFWRGELRGWVDTEDGEPCLHALSPHQYLLQTFKGVFVSPEDERVEVPVEPGRWQVFDSRTGRYAPFDLPGFDHYYSRPAVRPPYIAYLSLSGERRIGCNLVSWPERKTLLKVVSEETLAALDLPGALAAPEFSEDGRTLTCTILREDCSAQPCATYLKHYVFNVSKEP